MFLLSDFGVGGLNFTPSEIPSCRVGAVTRTGKEKEETNTSVPYSISVDNEYSVAVYGQSQEHAICKLYRYIQVVVLTRYIYPMLLTLSLS